MGEEKGKYMDNSMNLIVACQNGQKGVVQMFLKAGGVDVNKRDEAGNTALFYACSQGARDIAKLLLENGADPCLANNQGLLPLHGLSGSGNKEIAKLLLEAGADVNAGDNQGKTALMHMIEAGRSEAARFLMDQGADLNAADNEGRRAADYAAAWCLGDVFERASSAQADSGGNTALHQACFNNRAEAVKELVKTAELNGANDGGETPLLLACKGGNLLIAQILVEAGADVDKGLWDGSAPLHFAAGRGNLHLCRTLINAHACLNSRNGEGATPLLLAASQGKNEVVALLVESGADVNIADNWQHTPLYYADRKSVV